jgi:hypothetical protein
VTIQDAQLALWGMWALGVAWFVWSLLRLIYNLFRRWVLHRFAQRLTKVYRG